MKTLVSLLASLLFAMPVLAMEDSVENFDDEVYVINLSDEVTTLDQEYFYNFGPVRLFRERRAVFFLRNNTRIPIYINDIEIRGDRAFDYSENCPQILFRGQQCRIRAFFEPHQLGLHRGEIELRLTPQEDIVLKLRGRGVWP